MAPATRRPAFTPPERTPQELAQALQRLASESGEPRLRPRRPWRPGAVRREAAAFHRAVDTPPDSPSAGAAATPATFEHRTTPTRLAPRTPAETPPPVTGEPGLDTPAALTPGPDPETRPSAAAPGDTHAVSTPTLVLPSAGAPEPLLPRSPLARDVRGVILRIAGLGVAAVLVLVLVAAALGGLSGPGARTSHGTLTPASTTIPAPPAPHPARHRAARTRHHAHRAHRRTAAARRRAAAARHRAAARRRHRAAARRRRHARRA